MKKMNTRYIWKVVSFIEHIMFNVLAFFLYVTPALILHMTNTATFLANILLIAGIIKYILYVTRTGTIKGLYNNFKKM